MITSRCQSCGSLLDTTGAESLCPACVLRTALECASAEEAAMPTMRPVLPRAFGAYQLLEEIGRGGMGVIYRAHHPALNRTVAVKLLLSGVHSSEAALQRFQLEAAAAAGLQHPNIVTIHDYGEVDGQPYYAMDLIAGRNLAEHCEGRPLPPHRAAEILRSLAGAVHYAHQRGVLHRDLKPSNVLVDEEGRPRVTDFGLAKMLGNDSGATVTGQMLGSPSYAAPEQLAGRFVEIGVATDVYGLGAIFYSVITGRAPFIAATPTETLRLVFDSDPLSPHLLNPTLPRDLETICLKCLARDPARRYATAAEVAEDVERFLSERPIRARPPSALYRARKFVRRHSVVVVATAVVVIALIAGLFLALAGYRRVVVEQRATEAARAQAEQLVGLMTQDLKPAIEQRGGLPQLLQMTEAAVRYYDSLPPGLRNTDTERRHADALATLARLRGTSLGDRAGAETSMRAALVLREKIARENPDNPDTAAEALWDEWELPAVTGDSAAYRSESRQEDFVRRWHELHTRFPDNLRVHRGLAEVLASYAQVAAVTFNKPKEAVAAATECRALVDELVDSRPQDKSLGDLVEKSLRALATAAQADGDFATVLAAGEQALAFCTAALNADPDNVKLREQAAEAARNLSYRASNPARAIEAERIAREHYRRLVELNPDDQKFRLRFAQTHMMECYYLFSFDGDVGRTRRAFREWHALIEPFIGWKGYEDQSESWTIECLYLAVVAVWAGEPAEARREIEQARLRFADWQRQYPEGTFERSAMRVRYLTKEQLAFYWLRDWPELARVARDCLAEIGNGLEQQPTHVDLLLSRAIANGFLGIVAQNEGRPAEAIALLQPALGVMRTPVGVHTVYDLPQIRGFVELSLLETLAQLGDLARARQLADELTRGIGIFDVAPWIELERRARVLTLAARVCDPAETFRCMALFDRAEIILTELESAGRLTAGGKEDLATIARLRAAAIKPDLNELQEIGRELDDAAATDPEVIERITRAGEVAWSCAVNSSADMSPSARRVQLAIREGYRTLMDQNAGNQGFRFLFAETHRMECYVHFGWDGQVEPARAAFRLYDALLEPFVGRSGYDSVLRTRLCNSQYLAQLAASVSDRADTEHWLAEARKRLEVYREHLPEGSPDLALSQIRFLEETAWSAWWLRDWSDLARLAREARVECDARLKELPANPELRKRQAMADGFAELAAAGAGTDAGAATRLQAARNRLRESIAIPGDEVVGAVTQLWILEDGWVGALRESGDIRQSRNWAEHFLGYFGGAWGPQGPGEYWRGQKHLAAVHLQAASVLDPAIPAEAVRRKELLDRVAAALAPEKTEGRLTVDVQEMLRKLELLRAAPAN